MTRSVQLTPSTVVVRTDILSADVGGEVVLMKVESGNYYGLDPVGSDIWNRLETPTRVGDLCAGLSAEYDAEPETIAKDVLDLLNDLLGQGLIEAKE